MNERIRQLIKQADLDDDMFPVDEGWEYPELKKFAELIVQECAELATKEYNNRGAIHGNDLLQHFGVE